jgi:hypothetical protein
MAANRSSVAVPQGAPLMTQTTLIVAASRGLGFVADDLSRGRQAFAS